jgi:hypothetical protein
VWRMNRRSSAKRDIGVSVACGGWNFDGYPYVFVESRSVLATCGAILPPISSGWPSSNVRLTQE